MSQLPETFGGIEFNADDGASFSVKCMKCGRPVNSWIIDTPVESDGSSLITRMRRTGEIILTVECHGEKWRASNWRGIIR